MNRFIQIVLLFMAISCKNESSNSNNTSFIKTFEGEIGSKYEIVLKMRVDNGNAEGNYFYRSTGEKLKIKGVIDKLGDIILNEFDTKGNQTGIFKGKIINGTKLLGTWSKADGGKEMDFTLIESNTNFEGVAVEQEKKAKEKFETQKEIESDKERIKVDIKSYVIAKHDCRWKTFGGYRNMYVTLSNNTNYQLDEVKATLSVIKSNKDIYYTEELSFDKIPAWENKIVQLADSERGNEVKITIWKIKSKELGLDYNTNFER